MKNIRKKIFSPATDRVGNITNDSECVINSNMASINKIWNNYIFRFLIVLTVCSFVFLLASTQSFANSVDEIDASKSVDTSELNSDAEAVISG